MTGRGARSQRLADWYREWRQPLRRYLTRRRIGSAADVDDIAQEVFLRLLRYENAPLVDHAPWYLFKIAANVSAEWGTRSSRRLPHDSVWLAELVDLLSPDVEVERQDFDERLRVAVETLPPRAQEILRLHFGEGMAGAQIANTLGISRKMVKRDIARAYASLRITLESDVEGVSRRSRIPETS